MNTPFKRWVGGFVFVLVFMSYWHSAAMATTHDPCHNVIEIAAVAETPDQSLSLLGACLATPAPLPVLQRVALQMAIVSFKAGDPEWGMQYLDILRQMLEDDEPDPVQQP